MNRLLILPVLLLTLLVGTPAFSADWDKGVAAPQSAWNQSISASTDTYMKNALSQVRKSEVGLPETLTRFHGSWVYNQK